MTLDSKAEKTVSAADHTEFAKLRNATICIIYFKRVRTSEAVASWALAFFPCINGLCRYGVETHVSRALWRGDHTCMLPHRTREWKVKVGPATTTCHRC